MPIAPDTKDWTWVLERPCPECGFDAAAVPPADVARRVREAADRWAAILSGPPELLGIRPRDDRWSPLEYGCHVRDVFVLFDRRLGLMVTEDDPTFANWDQDATALEERYDEQDAAVVAAELGAAAATLAASFDAVQGATWDRRGSRSDGATFTVASFARYLLHDPVHHLYDVGAEPAPDRGP
jgi:DinB family protein